MLSISNLKAAYGKVEVLHGIPLEVPNGKVVTLIGSNSAGTVMLAGKDVTGQEAHRIARTGLAHSPEGRRVFATMSVADHFLLGALRALSARGRAATSRRIWSVCVSCFPV